MFFESESGDFISHMKRLERSGKTIAAYSWALKHFFKFAQDHQVAHFDEINRTFLERWQDYLASAISTQTKNPLSPRSRRLAATSVKMFFLWAAEREKCDAKLTLWFTKVKLPDLQPKPLKSDVMIRIRHFFLEKTGDSLYLRNKALFFYIIGVGARVSEVLRVPRDGWEQVTVVQKGGSTKVMTCPDYAAEMIRTYLLTRKDNNSSLWVNRPGNINVTTMRPAGVRGIWKSLTKQLSVARFTTHQLRHTAATAMLAAGEDPMTVATFLGHKNLSNLKVYAQVPEATRIRATATINRFLSAA